VGASRSSRSATASAASRRRPDANGPAVALDPGQRTRLLHAKLRSLVASNPALTTGEAASPVEFPNGAALLDGDRALVLVDDQPHRALGAVLAWAQARDAREVHVLVDDGAGVLARRAALFAEPPSIWKVDGNGTTPAAPTAPSPVATPPATALDLVGALHDAGLEIVIEHGEVRGELRGLELARVAVDDRGARIEVGVGRHDREAFAMVHGDVPTADALRAVADEVRRHRRPGDLTHPLARLAPERWLRHTLVREPALAGAAALEPVESTVARANLKDPAAAIAVGVDEAGHPIVVASSVGVDLDLVPAAADARAALAPSARLVLALPARDVLPVTERLAASLRAPAEIAVVPDDFRR